MASRSAHEPLPRPVVRFRPGGVLGRLAPLPPMWLEGRLAAEYVNLIQDPIFYGRGVPRGDGRPVFLIPGFLAGDQTLRTMQSWLRRLDYLPVLSGIRFNVHYSELTLEGVLERLYVHHRRTKQKVALVGHSRGGLLAKVLADRNPELVSQVITLGSPLNAALDVHPVTMAAVHAARFYNWVRFRKDGDPEATFMEQLAAPPAVPVTSLYTRSDGVVNWEACLRDDVTAIEVHGSHGGLGVNAEVYHHLARLLPD
jgi:triacylglycerol lipase